MKRTDRIIAMEKKYDKAIQVATDLEKALENFKAAIPEIEELISYYESELWREDYAANRDVQLPLNLKRVVLSQDGIYNLLTDYHRLRKMV